MQVDNVPKRSTKAMNIAIRMAEELNDKLGESKTVFIVRPARDDFSNTSNAIICRSFANKGYTPNDSVVWVNVATDGDGVQTVKICLDVQNMPYRPSGWLGLRTVSTAWDAFHIMQRIRQEENQVHFEALRSKGELPRRLLRLIQKIKRSHNP
jgi:hypothetical protein